MTTAHRPTWHPAVGSVNLAGYRYYSRRHQFTTRGMASHTKLKFRQVGQGTQSEVQARDLKHELVRRERDHHDQINQERRRKGLLPYASGLDAEAAEKHLDDESRPISGLGAVGQLDAGDAEDPFESATNIEHLLAQFDDEDDQGSESSSGIDNDNVDDDDDNEKNTSRKRTGNGGDAKANDVDVDVDVDGDSLSVGDSDSDSDSDSDEEAELFRELARIKQEREEASPKKAEAEAKRAEEADMEAVLQGNPLLSSATSRMNSSRSATGSFNLKRRWDDDVVFRHQARDQPKRQKRFINDPVRSDFHRKFMRKYMQ